MIDYGKKIEKIKNPENIRGALFASSPYVLKKAFEKDQTVINLIKGGREVIPPISEELEKKGLELPEITLACFAYILYKVDLKSAVKILKPLFTQAVEKPGPFFVNFAAHILRQGSNLPIKPLELVYTRDELLEVLKVISIPS